MSVNKRLLPQFLNLAPGAQNAALDLPLGQSYRGIMMRLSATGVGATFTVDHILRVRLLINGKAVIRDISGSVLKRDNLFRGSKDDNTVLYLDFEEPRARTIEDQLATCIHTAAGVNSFKIELDISSSAVGTLKIDTRAFTRSTGLPLGPIPAIIRESYDAVSTGFLEVKPGFKVGPTGPGHILRCVHFVSSVAGTECAPSTKLGTNGITVRKSGVSVWDRLSDPDNRWTQEHYESVPITNAYTLDFVEDNNNISLMPTADADDFVFEIDQGTACHWDIYYRMVTTLERL